MYILHNVSRHWFAYVIFCLFIYIAAFSYIRFFVSHDYVISFEGECDPVTASCFIGCIDDECIEPYYYKIVERPAELVKSMCGPDITDCQEVSLCSEEDSTCYITYCDASIPGENCEVITNTTNTQDSESSEL